MRVDAMNSAIKSATNTYNKVLQQSLKTETAALNKALASAKSLQSKLAKTKGLVQAESKEVSELGAKITRPQRGLDSCNFCEK